MPETPAIKYGKNPLALFSEWFEEAKAAEPNDPEAFCLATADAEGRPSARMLLLKDFSDRGFKFHTSAESRKGLELIANPHGCICFYWKTTRKQIRIEGPIEVVGEDEADDYFKTRPRPRQIGAWASRQSQRLESPEALEAAVQKFEKKFEGADVPRPPAWKGFRLKPDAIEFWIGQKDRLHTRFVYRQTAAGQWDAEWLNP
jgi:pyridoxamine 5'-phosphate oxidase